MKALFMSLVLALLPLALAPTASAAPPCHPDQACCEFGEVAIAWRCVGACDVIDCQLSAPPTCFSQVDDMIHDGGTTYCIHPAGPCYVSASTEYIWGREYHCVLGA